MKRELVYFAWVRERIGHPRDIIESDAQTPAELVAELRNLSDHYAAAFADLAALRVAIDQELADFDTPLGHSREVAFFPPMTGG
ncbi:molybdopterin converting factor subunit 1 [Thioclava sp. GXIMD4216]|uniref:Molybdopterin converting factor subunit 1 n=1 Tax=Thioclava litoralis TaxID=3076557 RepID=A0ABZ1E3N3_9RHOB|nr:molybdopterin converting factor subunit 1 [Thioclava sp. FTW29]